MVMQKKGVVMSTCLLRTSFGLIILALVFILVTFQSLSTSPQFNDGKSNNALNSTAPAKQLGLVDNGDGTITDTNTNLMWLKNAK